MSLTLSVRAYSTTYDLYAAADACVFIDPGLRISSVGEWTSTGKRAKIIGRVLVPKSLCSNGCCCLFRT